MSPPGVGAAPPSTASTASFSGPESTKNGNGNANANGNGHSHSQGQAYGHYSGNLNTSMVKSNFLSNPEDLGVVAVGFSGGQVRSA